MLLSIEQILSKYEDSLILPSLQTCSYNFTFEAESDGQEARSYCKYQEYVKYDIFCHIFTYLFFFRLQLQILSRLHILQQQKITRHVIENSRLIREIFEFLDLLAFYQIENRFLLSFIDETVFPT
jgi:hypothetical protein